MAENNLLDLAKLQEYLSLVPQAAQDPAFYQIMMTGLEPQQAAAQDLSAGNQLTKFGAGALQGAASIGNTFGNLIDPLASALESKFGTFTAGGMFPTVAEARANRANQASNYDAIYGGSIPAAIGRDLGLETLGGPLIRAGGNALTSIPQVGQFANKLLGGNVGQRVAGQAAAGAGAGVGYGVLASSGSEAPLLEQLGTSAAFGAGLGGVQGVKPTSATTVNATKPTAPPTELALSPNYSPAEQAVMKAEGSPKAGTGQQWLQWVNGAQARGQLSKEERQDIGLDQWLAQKQAAGEPVRREDVQAFIQANRPQVEVVTPGGGIDEHGFSEFADEKAVEVLQNIVTDKDTWELLREDKFPDMPAWDSLGIDERDDFVRNHDGLMDDIHDEAKDLATEQWDGAIPSEEEAGQRYASYQLPGGENYHERLITVPTKANPVQSGDFSSYTKASPVYQSNHWDEPNVLAHWRANERPIGDVPSYHVEEVQSDWHQEGRTKGYQRSGELPKEAEGWKAVARPVYNSPVLGDAYELIRPDGQGTNNKVHASSPEEAVAKYFESDRIPHAPFKKSWEQLTVKNALKEAVDRGFTRFSWTPGELQSTATGEAKNVKGNDERYNKRLVNIVNDLGKKYGTKVQFKEGALEATSAKKVEARNAKIPYVDLTPEMINDIKSGKLLSLY